MAITLQKSLAVTISGIISGSVNAARAAKSQEISTKEAAFQAAVAEGMSYEAQIEFRTNQLTEEKKSGLPDADYITTLTQSVGQIKKLNRFNKYRMKYQDSFADLKAGRETAEEHLALLKQQLELNTDPELELEIKSNITAAEQDVKTYFDNILTNQVTRARNDGTVALLNDAIQKVSDRRSKASLHGNEEEVSAYDNTLTVLKSQLNKTLIEDKTNSLEIKSIGKAFSPLDKVRELNSAVESADASAVVTVDGKRYGSAQEYWIKVRDAYLSGNGSGIFSDFFQELTQNYNEKISAATNRDGYATTLTLDTIKTDFNILRNKPELVAFTEKINNLEANALGTAFATTAKNILARAAYNQDFKSADVILQQYQQRYGIDAEQYRLMLAEEINKQALQAAGGDVNVAKKIVQTTGVQGITSPQKEFQVATTLPTGFQRDVKDRYGLVGGQTVYDKAEARPLTQEEFFQKEGIKSWSEANFRFDTTYVPPSPVVSPTAVQPTAQPTAQPSAQPKPSPTALKETAPAPVAAPTPAPGLKYEAPPATTVTPAPAATPRYSGSSIVDYLSKTGQDSSFTARKRLAEQYGITGYQGTADQNLKLLGILNK